MGKTARLSKDNKEDFESFIDYRLLSKTIIRYWQWILLSIIVCLCISFLYLRYTPPVYRVIAKILVKDDEGNRKNNLQNITNLGTISQNYGLENESQIITSSIIAERAVSNLKLYVRYKQSGQLFGKTLYINHPVLVDLDQNHLNELAKPIQLTLNYKEGQYHIIGKYYVPCTNRTIKGPFSFERKTDKLPIYIRTKAGTISISSVPGSIMEEHTNIQATIYSPQTIANLYAGYLTVEPTSEGSSVIKLIMNDKIPSRAIDYLQQLIICYNLQANEDKNEVAVRTEAFINDRLAIINSELGKTDGDLELFKHDNQLVELKTDARESSANADIFEQKLKEANTQIAIIKELETIIVDPDITKIFPRINFQNISINTLVDEYNKNVLERNRLLHTASENSPIITPLTENLYELSNSIRSSLQQAENEAIIKRNAIVEQHHQYHQEISKTPKQERILTQIGRQQEVKSGLYLMLLQKREENSISLAATVDKGKIIEKPTIAGIIKPRSALIYPLAIVIGLFIPTLFFYLRQVLRDRIEDHEMVASLTDLPIIADIPFAEETYNKNTYIVVHENENNLMEECFRYLRTNLQFMLKDNEKVLVFTSTLADEGKSFNAANTALSFALLGKKVIIVGLDIRKPQLSKIFGINTYTNGITNLLMINNPTDEQIRQQIVPSHVHDNLDLLLSGPIPPNPTELVERHSLEQIFSYLRHKYDYIIVDAAPVGLVTDTLQIGRVCDLTVYVCRVNYTPKSSFEFINELNSEKKLPHMSILINGINLSSRKNTYGYRRYGGYKGYGHYCLSNEKKCV